MWGDKDKIIPRASFDALCTAIGSPGEVVTGTHSWLLADPDAFGEVMTNVMGVADLARSLEGPDAVDGRRPREIESMVPRRRRDYQTG